MFPLVRELKNCAEAVIPSAALAFAYAIVAAIQAAGVAFVARRKALVGDLALHRMRAGPVGSVGHEFIEAVHCDTFFTGEAGGKFSVGHVFDAVGKLNVAEEVFHVCHAFTLHSVQSHASLFLHSVLFFFSSPIWISFKSLSHGQPHISPRRWVAPRTFEKDPANQTLDTMPSLRSVMCHLGVIIKVFPNDSLLCVIIRADHVIEFILVFS